MGVQQVESDALANNCASDWDAWFDEAHLYIRFYKPLYSEIKIEI